MNNTVQIPALRVMNWLGGFIKVEAMFNSRTISAADFIFRALFLVGGFLLGVAAFLEDDYLSAVLPAVICVLAVVPKAKLTWRRRTRHIALTGCFVAALVL